MKKKENSTADQNRTIVDMAGRTVEIPAKIDKVAVTCYGGASHEIAVLGASDKIVVKPPMQRFHQLVKIFPHYADTTDNGCGFI